LRFAEEVPVLLRKSKSAFWVIVVVALLAGSAKVSVARSPTHYSVDSEFYPQLQLFGEVLQRVRSDYVEKPNDSKLIEAAINGMLSSLDPHSYYLNPRELREMQVQTSGEFGGLGLEVTMEDGVIKVVSPIEGTPAARAGLRSDDVITSLDKKPVGGLTLQEAVDKMRGRPRAPITLTIVRKGVDHPIDVKLATQRNPCHSR
jgi:carboxyl-terminal processing protease